MIKFFSRNLSFIAFLFIPILFLWHPNWLGIAGIQPYWPLFWLLPWSMIHGSINGLIFGLFLGLILDSISFSNSFTQIPGLILCGIWFGRISKNSKFWIGHFRYGLICSIASFFCGILFLLQIFINNFSTNNFFFFYPSIKGITAQVLLTGLLAPLMCSQLLRLFKKSKDKSYLS